jgi:autotransporter-associated beta strand protein
MSNNSELVFNIADNTGFAQGISGAGSLLKSGAGMLTLLGSVNYAGTTTVNGGTLAVVNASISGSATTVNSGTLAGDNSTLGNVIINSGGTFAPGGGGIGSLTVSGDLNLNGSSIFNVQFDSTAIAVDGVALNGNLNIASGVVLNVSDIGSNPSSIFGVTAPVITYSGTWNGGTFAGLPDDSYFMSAGQAYQISYDGGVVTLTMLAVIPEPGAAVSHLGGLGLLLGVRRRMA